MMTANRRETVLCHRTWISAHFTNLVMNLIKITLPHVIFFLYLYHRIDSLLFVPKQNHTIAEETDSAAHFPLSFPIS